MVSFNATFNPDGTLERVEHAYEQQAKARTDEDGQTGVESRVTLARIEQVSESVPERAHTFEGREELLRERFAETANRIASSNIQSDDGVSAG